MFIVGSKRLLCKNRVLETRLWRAYTRHLCGFPVAFSDESTWCASPLMLKLPCTHDDGLNSACKCTTSCCCCLDSAHAHTFCMANTRKHGACGATNCLLLNVHARTIAIGRFNTAANHQSTYELHWCCLQLCDGQNCEDISITVEWHVLLTPFA